MSQINFSDKVKDNIFAHFFNSKSLLAVLNSKENHNLESRIYEAIESFTANEVKEAMNKKEYRYLELKADRILKQQETYQLVTNEIHNHFKNLKT